MSKIKGNRLKILQLLHAHGPLSGGHMLEIDPQLPNKNIHTLLDRMEKRGWLSSYVNKIDGERNRPRRFYQLTSIGEAALQFALLEQSTSEETVTAQPASIPSSPTNEHLPNFGRFNAGNLLPDHLNPTNLSLEEFDNDYDMLIRMFNRLEHIKFFNSPSLLTPKQIAFRKKLYEKKHPSMRISSWDELIKNTADIDNGINCSEYTKDLLVRILAQEDSYLNRLTIDKLHEQLTYLAEQIELGTDESDIKLDLPNHHELRILFDMHLLYGFDLNSFQNHIVAKLRAGTNDTVTKEQNRAS